jgi:hypothetical protein
MRRPKFVILLVLGVFILGFNTFAQEEVMTDSGEIREVSEGEYMTDSGEIREVSEGEYMTDSGQIRQEMDPGVEGVGPESEDVGEQIEQDIEDEKGLLIDV